MLFSFYMPWVLRFWRCDSCTTRLLLRFIPPARTSCLWGDQLAPNSKQVFIDNMQILYRPRGRNRGRRKVWAAWELTCLTSAKVAWAPCSFCCPLQHFSAKLFQGPLPRHILHARWRRRLSLRSFLKSRLTPSCRRKNKNPGPAQEKKNNAEPSTVLLKKKGRSIKKCSWTARLDATVEDTVIILHFPRLAGSTTQC